MRATLRLEALPATVGRLQNLNVLKTQNDKQEREKLRFGPKDGKTLADAVGPVESHGRRDTDPDLDGQNFAVPAPKMRAQFAANLASVEGKNRQQIHQTPGQVRKEHDGEEERRALLPHVRPVLKPAVFATEPQGALCDPVQDQPRAGTGEQRDDILFCRPAPDRRVSAKKIQHNFSREAVFPREEGVSEFMGQDGQKDCDDTNQRQVHAVTPPREKGGTQPEHRVDSHRDPKQREPQIEFGRIDTAEHHSLPGKHSGDCNRAKTIRQSADLIRSACGALLSQIRRCAKRPPSTIVRLLNDSSDSAADLGGLFKILMGISFRLPLVQPLLQAIMRPLTRILVGSIAIPIFRFILRDIFKLQEMDDELEKDLEQWFRASLLLLVATANMEHFIFGWAMHWDWLTIGLRLLLAIGVVESMPDQELFAVIHPGPPRIKPGRGMLIELWKRKYEVIKGIVCLYLNRTSPVLAIMAAIIGAPLHESPHQFMVGWICFGMAIAQYLIIGLVTSRDDALGVLSEFDRAVAERRRQIIEDFHLDEQGIDPDDPAPALAQEDTTDPAVDEPENEPSPAPETTADGHGPDKPSPETESDRLSDT